MAAATGLAVARAFLAGFARGRIHGTRVVAFRLPTTIGTDHLIRVYLHQLVKAFSAVFAFVL